jgi:hypothetical protein
VSERNREESGRQGEAGRGPEAVPGPGEVLAEYECEARRAARRILGVVFCSGCGWQYGSYWKREDLGEYWGDCPRCGARTELRDGYQPERPARVTYREAKGPAQQVMEF